MMLGILIDTNVISEMSRIQPNQNVEKWLAQQKPDQIFISSVTLGELTRGVVRLPSGKRREAIRRWLEHDIIRHFEGRVLFFDDAAAQLWGELMGQGDLMGKPRPILDTQIAAIALKHKLGLATRNAHDFANMGLKVINPWH